MKCFCCHNYLLHKNKTINHPPTHPPKQTKNNNKQTNKQTNKQHNHFYYLIYVQCPWEPLSVSCWFWCRVAPGDSCRGDSSKHEPDYTRPTAPVPSTIAPLPDICTVPMSTPDRFMLIFVYGSPRWQLSWWFFRTCAWLKSANSPRTLNYLLPYLIYAQCPWVPPIVSCWFSCTVAPGDSCRGDSSKHAPDYTLCCSRNRRRVSHLKIWMYSVNTRCVP